MDPTLIAAGASLVGDGINGLLQMGQNKKNREHSEYMYDKNNAYNTPVMQMARFKEAGLNPHLIYGQGNSGNGSTGQAPPGQAYESKVGTIAQNYIANRMQQPQIDNLKKAQDVMDAEIQLKQAQRMATISGSAKTDQEVKQSAELFQTTLGTAQMNLNNMEIQGRKMESEIDSILQNTSLSETQQQSIKQSILESKAKIKSMQMDNNLKGVQTEYEALKTEMAKDGVNINDPSWQRLIQREIKTPTIYPKLKKFDKSYREWEDNAREKSSQWLKNLFK